MSDCWSDLETRSPVPIKHGTHAYAEKAEVLLWAFADGDGQVFVWDVLYSTLNWFDDLCGAWVEQPVQGRPIELDRMLRNPEHLVWFQNGGMFDFVVLHHTMPEMLALVPQTRRRDTMIQAFSHSMPGSLDKLGEILDVEEDSRKLKTGRALIRLFCVPKDDGTYNDKMSHPAEWQQFIEYAAGDIPIMRTAHKKLPKWNYRGKQIDLWHTDMTINNRGFCVDLGLVHAAIAVVEKARVGFGKKAQEMTHGEVKNATQRDAMLKHILSAHGVELPDMRADTLERRLQDNDLPAAVREMIGLRLVASMNSVSKYKALLNAVSSDGRMRGGAQFRGASRTGRYGHRLFQFGNLPRPTMSHELVDAGVAVALASPDDIGLVVGDDVMQWASSAIRGVIVAPPGKRLVVADLANIEGRVAAWLAGEDWKLQAFRDYDAGTGHDLYILAYAKSFNVDPATVGKKGPERQIGKVEELMFQYGGGVGAWLTGAATYGIDLDLMTEQVFPTLPAWAVEEAGGFLDWMYATLNSQYDKKLAKLAKTLAGEELASKVAEIDTELADARSEKRMGLSERTFIACDAIKRLWRKAHPAISSFWKELEDTIRTACHRPNVTFPCRKLMIRRSGAWLRISLPSGRELCYPQINVAEDGTISYTGHNTYTRRWEKVVSYGGKFFENVVQAVAADQFVECFPLIESEGFRIVVHVHDEVVAEVSTTATGHDAKRMGALMCSGLGWNTGLPLAAAGFETYRYRKD